MWKKWLTEKAPAPFLQKTGNAVSQFWNFMGNQTDFLLCHTAFFFDFDGTLVDIAPSPDAVCVSSQLRNLLACLQDATNGALAIISGRSIASLDALLMPLVLPMAGVHGAERRNAHGQMLTEVDQEQAEQLEEMACLLEQLVRAHPGLLLEVKGREKDGGQCTALAVHFRQAPELAPVVHAAMTQVVSHNPAYHVQSGKMVFEIKPRQASKGHAISAFMQEMPFAGKTPLFAGDDVTDESGFECVNAYGGLSVKIGVGQTQARKRFDCIRDWLGWLEQICHAPH